MKKTMICRSNGLFVLPVAALLLAAPAAAQDTTTSDGNRVHVVREGETLWTLAEFYMGDPYLWPHIYRINPHVVEDPHWIFPGESLLLIPPDTVMVTQPPVGQPGDDQSVMDSLPPDQTAEDVTQVESAPPPPPLAAAPGAETVFASNRLRSGSPTGGSSMRSVSRNPSRIAFYASGFLTEQETLPWAHISGATDQNTLGTLTATSAANVNERVSVIAPAGATYQVGDSLLTAFMSREVVGWGNVIKPSGIVTVLAVSGREVLAQVVTQFSRITDGQVAIPVEPYRDASNGSTVPIENGMTGLIVATRDQNSVPNQHEVMFVDKGRADGVALGDVFEAFEVREDFPGTGGRTLARLTVVHVRENSATAQVTQIRDIGFGTGTSVRMVRRAGS
jgi:hypothetical protein